MTYLESYMSLNTIDEIKQAAIEDAKFAMIINPDRIRAIEEAMNEAIKNLEKRDEVC